MLQWMGGSRRKVTTSRKSMEKRQKQFFEQRRRQQQHEAAFTENHADASTTYDRPKGKRSLDILSLLDEPNVTEVCRPQCGNDHHTSGKPTILSHEDTVKDGIKPTVATIASGAPSSREVGTEPSESTSKSTSSKRNVESQCKKKDSIITQELSILDLIRDDDVGGKSGQNPAPEAHVSFSIQGLGNLGTETPKQSPKRPGRMAPGDELRFAKAAKRLHSYKNFNTMMNELGIDVEAEKPSCGNHADLFPISEVVLNPLGCIDHGDSTVKKGMEFDRKQFEMHSPHIEEREHNFWNGVSCTLAANSPFLHEDMLDTKCALNWKNGNSIQNSCLWRDESPHFQFEGRHLPVRCQEEMTVRFKILEKGDCQFLSLDEPKYSSFTCNYRPQADYSSPFHKTWNDTGDTLTSLSEDSCSSTAVRGEGFTGGHRRAYAQDMQFKPSARGFYEEMQNRTASSIRHGKECDRSRIYASSNLSQLRSSASPQGNVKSMHDGCGLLEEGFPFSYANAHPGPSLQSSAKNQEWKQDLFGCDEQDDLRTTKCFSGRYQKKQPDEFLTDGHAFSQPFSSRHSSKSSPFPKASCGDSWLGVCHDFEVHVQSTNSTEVADFFGERESPFPISDLSAGSFTKGGADKSQNQPPDQEKASLRNKNVTPESSLPNGDSNTEEYGTSFVAFNSGISPETAAVPSEEDMEEISWSMKFPSSLDGRLQGSILALHQQEFKVSVGDDACSGGKVEDDKGLKKPEAKSTPIEPSCQVMLVESYVQLLCMAKGKSIHLDATPMQKLY